MSRSVSVSLKRKLKSLSEDPGIYKMLDAEGSLLYIGKAKNLKRRVTSYFTKFHEDIKTRLLVTKIADFKTIVTHTEEEALILERQLIREFSPHYNIQLKDDKSYPYIRVTLQEPFPRVLVVHQKYSDGASYFGPFPSIGSTRRLQRLLIELFPIRDCTKYIDSVKKQRKCIQLDLGNCIGPCVHKDVAESYQALIQELMMLLKGQNSALLAQLKDQMAHFSDVRQYERAAEVRDKIVQIERIGRVQLIDDAKGETFIVGAVCEEGDYVYCTIQRYIEGKLLYQHGYYHRYQSLNEVDRQGEYDHFVQRCALSLIDLVSEDSPKDCFCDEALGQVVLQTLEDVSHSFSKVFIPQRGAKKELVSLAHKNAVIAAKRIIRERKLLLLEKPKLLLENVQETLGLKALPQFVAGFDISHLQGQDIVASSVLFKDGKPFKQGYRHYKIKTIQDQSNDPASLYEVVYRRLKQHTEKGEVLPQLLLIDGGKAQLNFAYKALSQVMDPSLVDICSIAKREELLFFIDRSEPLKLSHTSPVLQFLMQVRDESHRFALTYQRKKRRDHWRSFLEDIPGLGKKRLERLYSVYGSLKNLVTLTPDEVSETCGIPLSISQAIIETVKTHYDQDKPQLSL